MITNNTTLSPNEGNPYIYIYTPIQLIFSYGGINWSYADLITRELLSSGDGYLTDLNGRFRHFKRFIHVLLCE